jgi:hypothetical protein
MKPRLKKLSVNPPEILNAAGKRIGALVTCLILGVMLLPQSVGAAITYTNTVLTNLPVAFWQLNDFNDASTGTAPAVDSSGNGHNGTYGTTSLNGFNGITGPQGPTYPGFPVNQSALQTASGDANSPISIPHLNLFTNAVTITMWINPNNVESTFTGLLMNRDTSGDAAGLGFGGTQNGSGMAALGYTWNNNDQATWSYNSGLFPIMGVWQFVALVITPNSATFYLYYVDPITGQPQFSSAVNTLAHTAESFANGFTTIGSDVLNGVSPDGGRAFSGSISDVAVFNKALSQDQVLSLFAASVGVSGFLPTIATQPQSQYVLAGAKATFSATGINGASPFHYQWQLNGTNVNLLPDSANFSGANSNVLNILSTTASDLGTYQLIITNPVGTTLSTNVTLAIQSPALVGEWLDGSTAGTNLLDVSGYSLAGNHGGYYVNDNAYVFTNDVPPGKTGQSIYFYNGDSAIAISNSSSLDLNSDNTFDNRINNAFTVAFWAKGLPGGWNPWVSKYGENGAGWQLRDDGSRTNYSLFTVRDNNSGTNTFGTGLDDMATRSTPTSDGKWHLYVGTFNASTGVRNLYIDGPVLAASESGNVVYNLALAEHLCIGGRDAAPGNTFGNFFTGQIYDVRIYNYELGSNAIQQMYGLTIPAAINVQPQPVSVIAGRSASIVATAGGTIPISYQWQLNGTNINLLADSTNFIGANSNILTVISASAADAGSYRLNVVNSFGSDTSTNALLTVVPRLLLGSWFNGASSLADVSGYQPPGTHDGFAIGGTNYQFSGDVPPGKSGVSLYLNGTDTGIAIHNSAQSEAAYTNTFDDTINSAMTVAFWARGWPGGWNPWVSKQGEGLGWQLRNDGNNGVSPCWTIRGGGGTVTLGTAVYGNAEDMAATSLTYGNDGNWHSYVGTYNAATGIRNLYVGGVLVASVINQRPYNLSPSSFLCIGARDTTAGNTFGNFFTGKIFDVRIYNYDWTSNEVANFSVLPDPSISGQPPAAISAYVGLSTKITVSGINGTSPITNRWQFNGTDLTDGSFGGATITGSTSNVLTIANLTTNLQGSFHLVVSNSKGILVSSNTVLTALLTAPAPATNLIGAWLTGAPNLADASGHSPPGLVDAYGVTGAGVPSSNYGVFTNDVPPGMGGQSLAFSGAAGLAISNSSTLDAAYTNTFDEGITNGGGFTVTVWAKGWPGQWNPWVSKWGENGQGWQLRRRDGNGATWTLRGTGNTDDPQGSIDSNDGQWHNYTGTWNAITGERDLYVDGALSATQIDPNLSYTETTSSHLAIGARDGGGNSFGAYYGGEIYGVRIYNTALSQAQVNSLLVSTNVGVPVLPRPIRNGNQLVFSWTTGTLQQSTNVTGPWVPTGATSPYTNTITSTNAPRMFYRLSIP